MAKVITSNDSMCAGTLYEYNDEAEKFDFLENFMLSHDALYAILDDDGGDDGDDDGEPQSIFQPDW